jgi:uncharacterized protein YdcH (DUF465 family)
VESLYAKLKS